MRSPIRYVVSAKKSGGDKVYSPVKALGGGIAISLGFSAYEAQRIGSLIDPVSEQLTIILVLPVLAVIVHGVSRLCRGAATFAESVVAFEYVYGFTLPTVTGSVSLLGTIVEMFPGVRMRITLTQIDILAGPTPLNVLIISVAQVLLFALAVYVAVVIVYTIARVQDIAVWKSIGAYLVAIVVLLVVAPVLYGISVAVTGPFSGVVSALFGGGS